MLILRKLSFATNNLALAEALCQARLGYTPWTPELAREHNHRWLTANTARPRPADAPRRLHIIEDGCLPYPSYAVVYSPFA